MNNLDILKVQYRNAKKRARYWSGVPSSRGFGYNPCANNGRDADLEYETAMDDCSALADEIMRLTGKRPSVPSPKEDYNHLFATKVIPALATKTDRADTPAKGHE
ncbi:hypothetical protein [Marinobacter sp.]|uniref:hypothetical protein n=1 Tax=Marinobacter sp. TaxID=50741 RepID=UPI003A909F94